MTIDSDDMISLPSPPPPRPAARRDAIDAALRKFDGVEDAPAERAAGKRPSRIPWATMHRRPAGALVTAALIAVVFIPAVPFILRNSPPDVAPQVEAPGQVQPDPVASTCAGPDCAGQPASEPAQARSDEAVATSAPPPPAPPLAPPVVAEERREVSPAANDQKAAFDAPAPLIAAPAPPPPPPPEPAAEGDQNIVVTGGRLQTPNVARQGRTDEMGYLAKPASPEATIDPNGEFLSHLQSGLKANDRRAIIRLIAFPLRVTYDDGVRIYRSSRELEPDYDEIFSSRVRSSVLKQRPDALVSRDRGRLTGNGRIWFGQSSDGSIRIREINP